MQVTPDELAEYSAALERRAELAQRRERAWALARAAAALLKEQSGASRIVLFGSLAQDRFTWWSDVDIAAWELSLGDTFKAVAAVLFLDGDIEVNLVDAGACRPSLLACIKAEGIEL